MKRTKTNSGRSLRRKEINIAETSGFLEKQKEESFNDLKSVLNILREPVVVLDKYMRILIMNEPFSKKFQLDPEHTEGKILYEISHRGWDIAGLRQLLEEILPENNFLKGFELEHVFPFIGRRILILNAQYIGKKETTSNNSSYPMIVLAIEDITDMILVAETLADHAKKVNFKFNQQAEKMESHIVRLEREMDILRHKV